MPPEAGIKRQARGERRMAELLSAAEAVFAQIGYEQATTNGIAAQAGVSPGTLYQFFKSKGEMAEALARRYAVELEASQNQALLHGTSEETTAALVDRMVDPFLRFRDRAPAFDALMGGGAVSAELASRIADLKNVFFEGLVSTIATRLPQLSKPELRLKATVAHAIFDGMLPLTGAGSASARKKARQELKLVLRRYLFPD